MKATIVFKKIWDAINAKTDDGKRKYKYIILTGSSRSSKTYSILQSHWITALTVKNKRISIWRETKADCRMTILTDLKKAVTTFPNTDTVNFNKTESIYSFNTGSNIEFMGGDEENRLHGFQGDIAHLNEPYKFSQEAFDQIDMRTSDYIIIDWNPKKKHWIDDLSKRENAIVIHSTYKDNPFVPEEQKIKIESYLSVKYCQVVLDSLITHQDAYNYDLNTNSLNFTESQLKELKRAFNNEKQGTSNEYMHLVYACGLKAEKPNRIYSGWNTIDLQDYIDLPYNEYHGFDFGKVSPSALLSVKFDGEKTFYVRPRMYKPMQEMKEGLPTELLKHIKTKDVLVVDPADKENRLDLMRNGFNVLKANKLSGGGVFGGISLVQKFNIFYVYDEDFEDEYENYEWEVIQGFNLDRPVKENDHYMDALKYIITWLSRYLNIK